MSALGDTSTPIPAGPGLRKAAFVALAVGLLGLVLSLLGLDASPRRFAHAWVWGFTFVMSIGLGALFLVTLQHLTASVWSTGVRRVAELIARPLWLLALLFVPLALMAWRHEDVHLFTWLDPEHLAHSHLLASKTPYLNLGGFLGRGTFYVVVWALAAAWFTGKSLAQDDGSAGPEATVRMRRAAAPFLIVFALTLNFASYDWLMSLSPEWFSSMFGIYIFAGLACTALAVTTLGVLGLEKAGRLEAAGLREDHLYNLGALLFAFSCFWAYIAFSQFMLIWYGNLPEETGWFHLRTTGGWGSVAVVMILLRFVAPFLLLMSRRAKMHRGALAFNAALVLLGQAVDLYWLVMPQAHQGGPVLGWQEIGPLLLMVGALGYLILRSFSRVNTVAVGDPLLDTSRRFHL